MPFDGKIADYVKTKPIDRLIAELRGPAPIWWDFRKCETCAIGVAVRCGLVNAPDDYWAVHVRDFLGLTDWETATLFGYDGTSNEFQQVRPRHVAAALEHYRDHGVALSPFHFVKQEQR